MSGKVTISMGILSALILPLGNVMAVDNNEIKTESKALQLMEQTRTYVQQENKYHYYAATDSSRQMSQDKSRNMYGADNETGQGELKRERIRQRDGTGSGSKNGYGQSSSSGESQYGTGGGRGAGGGGGGGRR